MPESVRVLGPWLPLIAAATSALFTWLAIGYAHWREMLDYPERRRSHDIPTPRGGGIGIVIALLVVLGLAYFVLSAEMHTQLIAWGAGLLAIAGIGYRDDHRPLSALSKILVHLAVATLYICAIGMEVFVQAGLHGLNAQSFANMVGISVLLVVLVVWSINLHNFMDGINGLLAWQAVFVFCSLGGLALVVDSEPAGWVGFGFAAAALAFLPFNFPRARIFMGDVGSGALGFLLVCVVVPGSLDVNLYVWLILDSAFLIDAGCTLMSRMLMGRRWYSAHREHLYQWLVRCGWSHTRVVAIYAVWNLLIALPCAVLFVFWRDWFAIRAVTLTEAVSSMFAQPLWLVPLPFALGIMLWWWGKRWCRRSYGMRARYARA